MITPYDATGAIDLGATAAFVDWQIREGIHGLIPLGSTGEFLSLTTEERRRVAACVVEAAAGRVPVLIGTGAERTEDAVGGSRMARGGGRERRPW